MTWSKWQGSGSNGNYVQVQVTPKEFLQMISNVVNRREKKRGGLVFQGPNSCGKTWFTNPILSFFINTGDLDNWNKYTNTNFTFAEMINRRIGIMNECRLNGDGTQIETFKKLLEGEEIRAEQKWQSKGAVVLTPMIITTNNREFEKQTLFSERLHIFNMNRVPCMRGGPDCPGRSALHPFIVPMLFQHYDIETDLPNRSFCQKVTSLANFISYDPNLMCMKHDNVSESETDLFTDRDQEQLDLLNELLHENSIL